MASYKGSTKLLLDLIKSIRQPNSQNNIPLCLFHLECTPFTHSCVPNLSLPYPSRMPTTQFVYLSFCSLRKQMTFCNATNGFPAECYLRNNCRNYMLMMPHFPDLSSVWNFCSHLSDLHFAEKPLVVS